MQAAPDYFFLKQSASLRSYFCELCQDIPKPDQTAVVLCDLKADSIGNISFVPGPKYQRGSFGSRALSWLHYFAVALKTAFSLSGDPLVFVVAQPPFLPVLGYIQKKLLGRRYVLWIDDVYPDVLVRKKLIRDQGYVFRLFAALNRLTFNNCEHLFTISPHMHLTLQRYLSKATPVTISPTWVDTNLIYPIPRSENVWAKQHGLEDKFVVMYSGNFGETHDVESLLTAARQMRSKSGVFFILIGTGTKWDAVCRSVCKEGDSNVLVLPWQPTELLTQSLSAADLAYVSLGRDIDGVSMPSKIYYAMAAGSAILASCERDSDLGNVVEASRCGIIVRPGSVEEIVGAVELLSNDRDRLTATYKQNARLSAVGLYSRAVNVSAVRETVRSIAACNEARTR
jgi:glycosyltransferase involved in cell wall biosynthesis